MINLLQFQAGREIRVMVVPEQVSDDDMVLMARILRSRLNLSWNIRVKIKVKCDSLNQRADQDYDLNN